MSSATKNTIEGFNKFVEDQRQEPGKATLSLTQFDHLYEPNFMDVVLDEVPSLDFDNYIPRGQTALYDAIGRSVGDFETMLEKRSSRPDQVLFVIITDGEENHSQELDEHAVKQLLEAKHDEGWQFAYLGANQDAITSARRFGGQAVAASATNYASTKVGTANAFATLSSSTSKYRHSGQKQVASMWTDDDRTSLQNDIDNQTSGGSTSTGVVVPKKKRGK